MDIDVGTIDSFLDTKKNFSQVKVTYDDFEKLFLYYRYTISSAHYKKNKSQWKNKMTRLLITTKYRQYFGKITKEIIKLDSLNCEWVKKNYEKYLEFENQKIETAVDHVISTRLIINFIISFSSKKREESKPSFRLSEFHSLMSHQNSFWNLEVVTKEKNDNKAALERKLCRLIRNYDYDEIKQDNSLIILLRETTKHLKENPNTFYMSPLFRKAYNYLIKIILDDEIDWENKIVFYCPDNDCPCNIRKSMTKKIFEDFYKLYLPDKVKKDNNNYFLQKEVKIFNNYISKFEIIIRKQNDWFFIKLMNTENDEINDDFDFEELKL